jgi:hypothetical protein
MMRNSSLWRADVALAIYSDAQLRHLIEAHLSYLERSRDDAAVVDQVRTLGAELARRVASPDRWRAPLVGAD